MTVHIWFNVGKYFAVTLSQLSPLKLNEPEAALSPQAVIFITKCMRAKGPGTV